MLSNSRVNLYHGRWNNFCICSSATVVCFFCCKLKTLTLTQESYSFVSKITMFKYCSLIVEHICIMAGGMIFTFFQDFIHFYDASVYKLMFDNLLFTT
ncbi:hypothetical protein T03_15044 [Trichinella britovi]|uniref:Uncharacterized protein n=1 Tax=Trichinella britovi TaxID=45882 RepID=A0A0V1C3J6_TRIBR|nr:hypothetical protein T03_15044 [Trichinella britovi]